MAVDFKSLIETFGDRRVAVLGDVMLDVYLWGQVKRISPEAPVPVVDVVRQTSCLGGAGNVMRNIATLGGHAFAFGAIGDDAAGKLVGEYLDELGIDGFGMLRDSGRCTTEKRRIIAGNQQLMRVDFENSSEFGDDLRRRVAKPLLELISNGGVDAVIFEDYAKGLLGHDMVDEINRAARSHGIITALDPKPGRLDPVQGITVMKPNRSEAFALAGMPDDGSFERLGEVAGELRKRWNPDYLIISLAAQGMAIFGPDGGCRVIPTRAREVFAVSGAGDAVIATFALSMAAGADPASAAELANLAAGVVVGKVGTAPIMKNELLEAVASAK
ncbi:MAG: PfkB family carbohydrate kinase [Victivallaceae bacterium]|nr:PfkB family carbohydrate kinase [Victivallaceae bacterium]